ncbi:hypothetical protein ACP4J4_01665 [Aureimonas ureilytica]|uniref:hypothetical protein n=1 Tax=Aureimonas ureilytica TaxID=401562 RepID=UPI003CE8CE86
MSKLRKVAFQTSIETVDQATIGRLIAVSSQVCVITGVTAKTISIELDTLEYVPPEVGEMYEQMANVFLQLADQVRLKQYRI